MLFKSGGPLETYLQHPHTNESLMLQNCQWLQKLQIMVYLTYIGLDISLIIYILKITEVFLSFREDYAIHDEWEGNNYNIYRNLTSLTGIIINMTKKKNKLSSHPSNLRFFLWFCIIFKKGHCYLKLKKLSGWGSLVSKKGRVWMNIPIYTKPKNVQRIIK